jgi:hypothetical protein
MIQIDDQRVVTVNSTLIAAFAAFAALNSSIVLAMALLAGVASPAAPLIHF